jgi:GxxExxY protein
MAEEGVVVQSVDALVAQVESIARAVHSELGVALSETMYRNAMVIALRAEGLSVASEVPILVHFRNECVGTLRADIVVDKSLVVELKVVARIMEGHVSQARAYAVRLGENAKAVVLNFNAHGVESRVVDV